MAIRMDSRPRTHVALLLIGTLFVASASASFTSQFQHFYPQHGDKYKYILHNNCSRQYANYLTGRPADFELDWLGGGGANTVLVQPVVKCLLDNVSEYIKAASSSAQVILGVTPPILATLGASTDELGILTVVGRRPLLSLLLAFGSPSVYTDRAFGFRQPEKMLVQTRGRYHLSTPDTPVQRWTLVTMQYVAALGAAANIASLSWQLGIGAVCCWWPNTIYGPFVWSILSIPIYIIGAFATRLRVRRIYSEDATEPPRESPTTGFDQWRQLLPQKLGEFCKSEWVPAIAQEKIRTISCDEGTLYIGVSWLLSTGTIIHILFGSLLLSGLLFIGPQDALFVIFRYVLSVLVCRMVVVYELAGIRANHVLESETEQKTETRVEDRIFSLRATY